MFKWFSGLVSFVLNWFASTKLWVKLARHAVAHFTFRTFGYPKFPMTRYFRIKEIIESDPDALWVFVCADRCSLAWKLTNLMTGAKWGHAGFVVYEQGQPWAWHMKGNGLNKWHLLDILKESDDFALLRMELSPQNKLVAKHRFNQIRNCPLVEYDFQMQIPDPKMLENWFENGIAPKTGTKALRIYCSEFVYVVGQGLVENPRFKAKLMFGSARFEPDDAYAGCTVAFEERAGS